MGESYLYAASGERPMKTFTSTKQRPLADRFHEKYAINECTGCWIWLAALSTRGYAHFWNADLKLMIGGNRISWELHNGAIPHGKHVLHKCDNPKCVNPDHLFLGTHGDNMRDMFNKGRENNANRRKTHCKRGHEFTYANTYLYANGKKRMCKICTKARKLGA